MESKVADPIEEAVNSLSGIDQLRSTSLEGVAQVFVQFDLDVDLDVAAQDVRDRVASIQRELPPAAEQPVVEKLDIGASPIMQIAVSGTADEITLANYAEDVLKPGLERINGVGQLELVGSREREAHVWIDPDRLRTYGLTVNDVTQALRMQSIDLPGGRVTRGSEELVVRTNAQATTRGRARQRRDLRLERRHHPRARRGRPWKTASRSSAPSPSVDGKSAIAVVLRKQSDANTIVVADAVKKELPTLEKLAPPGTKVEVLLDNSTNIRSSVETVQFDLVLGAHPGGRHHLPVPARLARHVHQRARAAHLGHRHLRVREGDGLHAQHHDHARAVALDRHPDRRRDRGDREHRAPPRGAQGERRARRPREGTAEIGLAVLATTMSIVAVFVPVAFMEGIVGQFFYQFGLTVTFAVLLSLFVSFTLTPMLSARMLTGAPRRPARASRALIERVLVGIDNGYRTRHPLGAAQPRHHGGDRAVGEPGRLVLRWRGKLGVEFIPARGSRPVQRERRAAHRHLARAVGRDRLRPGGRGRAACPA